MCASSSEPASFLSFILERLVNEAHALNDVGHGYLVCPLALYGDPLRHHTRLVLYEVERLDHEVHRHLPVHADRQHSDHSALEAVAQHERRPTALLHVERDALQPAHVEEGLVLDGRETRVMQEATVHEVALLKEVILVLLHHLLLPRCELSIVEIVRVFDHLDRIVTRLWVQATFHKDVEEQTNRRVV